MPRGLLVVTRKGTRTSRGMLGTSQAFTIGVYQRDVWRSVWLVQTP